MHDFLSLACSLAGPTNKELPQPAGQVAHGHKLAAITVYLAGMDRVTSILCIFLYLTGMIDREWLSERKEAKLTAGLIICDRGLTRKIEKLCEVGLIDNEDLLRDMNDLIEVRNNFVHRVEVGMGYKVHAEGDFGEGRFCLRPFGIDLAWGGIKGSLDISIEEVDMAFTECIVRYCSDSQNSRRLLNALEAVDAYLARLPVYSASQDTGKLSFSELTELSTFEQLFVSAQRLNEEHFGAQCKRAVDSIKDHN